MYFGELDANILVGLDGCGEINVDGIRSMKCEGLIL